jgi:hypothetical protein
LVAFIADGFNYEVEPGGLQDRKWQTRAKRVTNTRGCAEMAGRRPSRHVMTYVKQSGEYEKFLSQKSREKKYTL